MKTTKYTDSWRYTQAVYFALGFLSFFYLYTIRQSEALASSHHAEIIRLLIALSVGIPELVIWLIAARGAVKFKSYALSIRKSKDGGGLNLIANALLLLLTYIVLLTIGGTAVSLAHGRTFINVLVVLKNHLPLAVIFASSVCFFLGARRLNAITPLRIKRKHAVLMWIFVAVFSLAFMLYFLHNQPVAKPQEGAPLFVLPLHLLLFTYVIPYIILWCLGAYSCMSLINYARLVKGVVYRPLFDKLAQGLAIVFIVTFLAQVLAVSNVNVNKITLLLVAVYVLLVLAAYGFLLIYQGADNLQRLEKV